MDNSVVSGENLSFHPEAAKPKIVVIMGPTGSGKSRLAIDLAAHFPVEIINADSMQVYEGLDVLNNKVPVSEQKGVKHHLLGTISPAVEFTCKDFRDAATPLINDIVSRNNLPVIVGGTNFYIQALVSPFLLDDMIEDRHDGDFNDPPDVQEECDLGIVRDADNYSYDCLKAIDPLAANRIHPNDRRKIKKYIDAFRQSGILPSLLFRGEKAEDWGRLGNSKYDCCFICVDASLPAIDRYVDKRVDHMIEAGLLKEVYDIFTLHANYTRGIRQAIGVREFKDFLESYLGVKKGENGLDEDLVSKRKESAYLKENMGDILKSVPDDPNKRLLEEAIGKLKVNTRRLVRRQKRRINRLQTLFGWKIHHVDSTETLLGGSDETWNAQVISVSAKVIRSFLNNNHTSFSQSSTSSGETEGANVVMIQKDLWTQYVCEACGDRVLRGAHEWEQHIQGRGHRKRVSSLRKQNKLLLGM